MPDAFRNKLAAFDDLSAEDWERVDMLSRNIIEGRAGDTLVKEGDRPRHVHLLLDGWACRYKLLPDGSRQILSYLIPGDLCDVHIFILNTMDHGIQLLSDARVCQIDVEAMGNLLETSPRVARALYWSALVDEATTREWLVNVNQRGPYERIAHLFCEMWRRMSTVGLVSGDTFSLPLTQVEIGDTLGLTPVAVNRVLQRLRSEGLISLHDQQLTILDFQALKAISEFNDNYLHLDRAGRGDGAAAGR